MAVIGDSIQWGVGLKEEHKMFSLVRRWLNVACNISVEVQHLAQTGALIETQSRWIQDLRPRGRAETPQDAPSILNQLSFIRDPSGVDLLVLNGGINDLEPRGIWAFLDIYGTEGEQLNGIRQTCTDVFTGKLEKLFRLAFSACPQALKVYTGYYPVFSLQSNSVCLQHYYATNGYRMQLRSVVTAAQFSEFVRKLGDFAQGKNATQTINEFFNNIKPRIARNCAEFFLTSSALAQETAQKINEEYSARPENAIHVTIPKFDEGEATFAPTPKFWGLTSGTETGGEWVAGGILNFLEGLPIVAVKPHQAVLMNFQTEDENKSERYNACEDAWPATPITNTDNRWNCRRASIGHPNIAGAEQYASAIIQVLYEFFPAATYTIPAIDSGFYLEPGIHDANNTNYMVGRNYLREYRNFFVFDLTPLIVRFLEPGVSWGIHLEVFNPKRGFTSPEGSEQYVVSSVTNPIEELRARHDSAGRSTEILGGLGQGTLYGKYIASPKDNDTVIKIGLYPSAQLDIRRLFEDTSRRIKHFAIGGRIVSLNAAKEAERPGEYLFACSWGRPSDNVRLVFTKNSRPF
jgi:hypothetical protein